MFFSFLSSQEMELKVEDFPDKLSTDFHQDRRTALRKMLPPNSLAVIFANPVRPKRYLEDYCGLNRG